MITHIVRWVLTDCATDDNKRSQVFESFAEAIEKVRWLVEEAEGVDNVSLQNIEGHNCEAVEDWVNCDICAAIDLHHQGEAEARAHHCTSWVDCYCI